MTKKIILLISVLCFCAISFAQTPTHRLRFKCRIKQSQLNELKKFDVHLVDANGKEVKVCSTLNVLKCLITNKDGELKVDPWAITDSSITHDPKDIDDCKSDPNTVNSRTPYPLKIDIQRGKIVGNPTKAICFHYQTWLIGVNTLGVKFRPKSMTIMEMSIHQMQLQELSMQE